LRMKFGCPGATSAVRLACAAGFRCRPPVRVSASSRRRRRRSPPPTVARARYLLSLSCVVYGCMRVPPPASGFRRRPPAVDVVVHVLRSPPSLSLSWSSPPEIAAGRRRRQSGMIYLRCNFLYPTPAPTTSTSDHRFAVDLAAGIRWRSWR
jgi:hypothetical protein